MAWSSEDKLLRLQELHKSWRDCTKCDLHKERKNVVFGSGDVDAKIFFVGEGPGAEEDLEGEPFIGASGQLLDDLLYGAGIRKGDVWISNLVGCRPPNNREPTAIEKDACMPRLREQIYIIDPMIIVAVGKQAMAALMGGGWKSIVDKQGQIGYTKFQGRYFPVQYPTTAILHPAYILRKDHISPDTGTWRHGGEVAQTLKILQDVRSWLKCVTGNNRIARKKLIGAKDE